MIVTVTLNPAFDHILFLPEINLGKFNRVQSTTRMPGGKGINVACSLAVLGEEVIATGLLGGQGCSTFERALRKTGVTTSFIYVNQEIRTDFFIIEEKANRQSLIVEKGNSIELRYLNSFKSNFDRLLTSAKLIEIGGSLPSGVAPNFVKELILAANKKKVKVVLNLPENIFAECMYDTNPFLVYPDLRENKSMFGLDIYNPEARLKIANKLLEIGVEIVMLKYGNLNYVVATRSEMWEGQIDLEETSVMIGVRDAVLAGFIHKYLEKENIGEALKYGLGAGRSSAKNRMNYPNSKNEVEEFLLMAKVRKVG
ncbi:MAG: PfkB family carbohydrate kinase [Candidatus Margulisiibacteriota bacterium]